MEDKIIILNNVLEVKTALGGGHPLQVKEEQRNLIHNFTANEIAKMTIAAPANETVQAIAEETLAQPAMVNEAVSGENAGVENTIVPEMVPAEENISMENVPTQEPIQEVPEVSQEPAVPQVETPVIEEVAEVVPSQEPVVIPETQELVQQEMHAQSESVVNMDTPVVPQMEEAPAQGVEIVSEAKVVSEYDTLMEELKAIDEECNQKIIDINKEREERKNAVLTNHKQQIEAEKNLAQEFKEKAEEHLKNAQAAEQIATIAHQNAMNLQAEQPAVTNVQTMENVIPFPTEVPTTEIPSLDATQVLTKAM